MNLFNYILTKRKMHLEILILLFIVGLILLHICFGKTESFWGALGIAFGTTFSAGSIVSFLDLIRNSSETISNSAINDILSSGILQINKHRDLEEYYDLIKRARSIDICGYSLRGFFQSHKDTILQLSKRDDFKLRIVFVNPESESSKNRECIEDGRHTGQFKESFISIVESLKCIHGVEIYTIDFALSTMIFRIDDTMYVGPHFIKEASKTSFTIKVDESGWAFQEFQNEFDAMVAKSKRIC